MNRALLAAATLLAFLVVGLGAYVRLSDAGLGCPDWPGCYGHYLGVPDAPHETAAAASAFPQAPLHTGKAWKEMVHRYAAGSLGLLILALCLQAWRSAARGGRSPLLPTLLLGLVVLQAALGMWTVTLLLKPVVVTLHLLGGMATLSLLVALLSDTGRAAPLPAGRALRLATGAALGSVIVQIALGGWVSSNYAALACTAFPACLDGPVPAMDFGHAYTLLRPLGETADGQALPVGALLAIHWSHRLWAIVVLVTVGSCATLLLRSGDPATRRWGLALLALLALQISLGIANVLLALPLPVAVAHTLGAAALLTTTLCVQLRLPRAAPAPATTPSHGISRLTHR